MQKLAVRRKPVYGIDPCTVPTGIIPFTPQKSISKVGHQVQKLAVRRKPVSGFDPCTGTTGIIPVREISA